MSLAAIGDLCRKDPSTGPGNGRRAHMISCAAGLQRADHGEHPLRMTVTVVAILGQAGHPGGGCTIADGVNGHIGKLVDPFDRDRSPRAKAGLRPSFRLQ